MDVWVVAAAAGAGLVVQRLKNLNLARPEVSSSRHDVPDSSCPFRRVLLGKRSKNEMAKEPEKVSGVYSTENIGSTTLSEGHDFVMPDNFGSCSSVSDTNSLSGFLNHEDFEGDRVPPESEEVLISNSMPQPSSIEVGISYGFRRNRSSIRSRRTDSQVIKPRTSLESCVMAQLYKGPGEFGETIYSSDQLQRPIVRPFVVSDGSRIISRLPNESFSPQTEMGKYELLNETYVMENKSVLGIPKLPYVVHEESQRKAKIRKGKEHIFRNVSPENENRNVAGLPDKGLHFLCGLTMGIISSFLANKIEMENLHKLLKQNENLVQDFQEELEMKDSVTVKELATEQHYKSDDDQKENYSADAIQASYHEREDSPSSTPDPKPEEESLSRIEAELEAELERLESNMNSSRLEGKLSNVAELDPDSIPDVMEGELRAGLFEARNGNKPYADRDGSGTTTPHSLPQPVSPRELTLRLHELIQSRLEQRVKELELALENSQRKLKILESSSTTTAQNSPIIKNRQQNQHVLDQHVVINLSGEALSAYNEAYEELAKVSESDGEDSPVEFEHNGGVVQIGDVRIVGPDSGLVSNWNRDTALNLGSEDYFFTRLNDVVCSSMEESDDEMERLLIRQIIEKAKQGSPAVLKAQRAFLLNEN